MARQSRAPTILLTRPAGQSARFAEALRQALPAVQIVESPLMSPEFLHPALPAGPWQALVLTSETAAEAARRIVAEGHDLPREAFCVGDRSAAAARAAGFAPLSAAGDAADLLALIRNAAPQGRLLYLRGREVAADVEQHLEKSGICVDSLIVYAQQEQALNSQAIQLFHGDGRVIAPVFSPRSARLLASSIPADRKAQLFVAAISQNAATAAEATGADRLVIAEHPDSPAMLRAVIALHAAASLP